MSSLADENGDGTSHRQDDEDNTETPLLRREDIATSPSQDTKPDFSIGFLIALTCINGGLQVFFSTVMANLAVRQSISFVGFNFDTLGIIPVHSIYMPHDATRPTPSC